MVNLSGMFNKAKRAVRDNPDAVRGGLDKVEGLINSKTKGKYADKLTKGRDGIDKALGVPGETRDAYREEAGRQERTDPVSTQPVDAPAVVGHVLVDEPDPGGIDLGALYELAGELRAAGLGKRVVP